MDRRSALAASAVALIAPRILLAQAPKRVYRIAILDDAVESARGGLLKVFADDLGRRGLVQSRNVVLETRHARGDPEKLPSLAAELVALKPDVVVCTSTPATLAAKRASVLVPIVFVGAGDPIGAGLVASFARPGGNVTGISNITLDIAGKQLELLLELMPEARSEERRVGKECRL